MPGVHRLKIWNADGVVVWSNKSNLWGQQFELGADARAVLASGGSTAALSDLRSPENRYEVNDEGFLEVYTRIENDHGEPMLFEAYYSAAQLEESTPPQVARRLRTVDEGIRGTVQSLRSLGREIYPPNLAADGLADALDELVVPASASGLDVRVRVDDVTGVSDDAVALVWRAAQEAVRNATRHARGSRIDVSVLRHDRRVSLRVADDGVGFVPGAFSHRGRFGLRSLQDLALEAGGRLDVETGPGRGTTVLLEVPA